MDKTDLINILEDWNFWKKDLITGRDRPYYVDKLRYFLTTAHVVVITGARKNGKSYILRQLARSLIREESDKKNLLMVNFEDPRLSGLNAVVAPWNPKTAWWPVPWKQKGSAAWLTWQPPNPNCNHGKTNVRIV